MTTMSNFDTNDIEKNRVMAILAYIFVFIPLIMAKESKFARFHTNQGLVLLIVAICYGIVYGVLTGLATMLSSVLGMILSILGLGTLAFTALAILGIVNAATGQAKELPIIGKYRLLK